MSTRHREQFADVGNGGELRFGEHRSVIRLVRQALDALALALADKGHRWTNEQRRLYERSIAATSSSRKAAD